jgi:hypothetical protein
MLSIPGTWKTTDRARPISPGVHGRSPFLHWQSAPAPLEARAGWGFDDRQELWYRIVCTRGRSVVVNMSACQAEDRGFESRRSRCFNRCALLRPHIAAVSFLGAPSADHSDSSRSKVLSAFMVEEHPFVCKCAHWSQNEACPVYGGFPPSSTRQQCIERTGRSAPQDDRRASAGPPACLFPPRHREQLRNRGELVQTEVSVTILGVDGGVLHLVKQLISVRTPAP